MLGNDFAPIELGDQAAYTKIWTHCPMKTADYSFVNLWAWADVYELQWRLDDNGLIWIVQDASPRGKLDVPLVWAPLGDWSTIDWTSFAAFTTPQTWTRTPEALYLLLQGCLGERVQIIETESQWEYVYLQEELATLPGNKYHKKRNHANQFKKHYGISYKTLDVDRIHEAIALQEIWCQYRACKDTPALLAEGNVVLKVLNNWQALPTLVGGSLYDGDRMVAFSVGEPLNDEMFIVHFEKAYMDYRGAYQAINMIFAEHAAKGYTYVNREQDAGEATLRHAKRSYFPNHFLRKNTIIVR